VEAVALLPRDLVPRTVALIVFCFTVTATMAVMVDGETVATGFDHTVADIVPGVGLMWPVGFATHPAVMIGLVVIIATIAVWRKRHRVALLAVVAPMITVAVNTVVLKPLIGRLHDGDLAFPSGHTATLVSILTVPVLAVVVHGPVRDGVVAVVTALLCVVIAVSGIIGIGYHYVTDTIGAIFWAVGAVLTIALVADRLLHTESSQFTRSGHSK